MEKRAGVKKGRQFYSLLAMFVLFTALIILACTLVSEQTISLIDTDYKEQVLTTVRLFAEYHSARLQSSSETEKQREALFKAIMDGGFIGELATEEYPAGSEGAEKLHALLDAYIKAYPLDDYGIYVFFSASSRAVGGGKQGDGLSKTTRELLMENVRQFLAAGLEKAQWLFYDAQGLPGTTTLMRLSAGAALVYVQTGPPPITMIPQAFLDNVQDLGLYYVDSRDTIVSMLADAPHLEMLDAAAVEKLKEEGVSSLTWAGKRYCCSYASFNDMGMGFIVVALDAPAMARNTVIRSGVLLLLGMTALCALISLYGIHRIYQPVQEVISGLPPTAGDGTDEMGRIQSALDSMSSTIHRQSSLIAKARLLQLLHGAGPGPSPGEGSNFFFERESVRYGLAIFRVEDSRQEYEYFDSALNNVENWLNGCCRAEGLELASVQEGEYLYAVFELQQMEQAGFIRLVRRLKGRLEAEEGLLLSAFLSCIHQGSDSLRTASLEAAQTAAYCGVIESFNVVMDYTGVAPMLYSNTAAGISFGELQNLAEAIESLDEERSLALFDQYAEKLESVSAHSLMSARLGMSLLRDGIAISLCEVGAENRLGDLELPVKLPALRRNLADVLASQRKAPAAGEESEEFAAVVAFVSESFRDPGFSALSVAERFGMSQSGVTRLFQKKAGVGFLEYVHRLRVELAKELLSTSDLSVGEVAERVGYSNTLTMTRAFKRYAGATPGKYKKQ